jgi:hypothetical protein
MTLNEALRVLMESASRDVRGSGLGYRSTTDEWRAKVSEAWAVAHRRVYRWEPTAGDYRNAGMTPPETIMED